MEKLEENKIIEIKDLENTYKFKINLFDVENGLNYFLKQFESEGLDEKKIIILLKQAILLNDNPSLNQVFSLELAKTIFRNPLSIVKLAYEINKFQEVFLKDFRI